jgi:hypothetical protein
VKPLSQSQARRCEEAKRGRCRCRCGGMLHGQRCALLELLPEGDPHYVPAKKIPQPVPERVSEVGPEPFNQPGQRAFPLTTWGRGAARKSRRRRERAGEIPVPSDGH